MQSILFGFLVFLMIPVAFAAQAECSKEVFLSKLCVSDQALPLGGPEVLKLVCGPAEQYPEIYAAFRETYDKAPRWFQKRLCQLQKLGVYTPATGTTLSWSYFVKDGFIGVSKLRLDEKHDLKAHAETMLRQAHRGKTQPDGVTLPASFGYQAPAGSLSDGLLYLLSHEMGHLVYNPLDRGAREASFHNCTVFWGTYTCPPFQPTQFGFIDWLTGHGETGKILRGTARAENDSLRGFILKEAPETVAPEALDRFFRELHQSSFVSAFALYSPEEDFCETFTHLVMAEASAPLTFSYLNGESLNVWDRVRSPGSSRLREKIEAVQKHMH